MAVVSEFVFYRGWIYQECKSEKCSVYIGLKNQFKLKKQASVPNAAFDT